MVTLTTATAALKTMYLDVVANQLNTQTHPFLAKVEHTAQDVVGKKIKKLVPYGVNGGIGAGTESGILPAVAENNYLLFEATLKNLYGSIEITDKALRASGSEAGAFVNLLTAEMEGLVDASRFNFARMLYGDGSGLLTAGIATESGGYVFEAESMDNLMVGQKVDVYVDDVFVHSTRITGWDYAENTVVCDKAFTADMADDTKTVTLFIQGSKDKEITGLGALFNPEVTSLYGVSKAEHSFLNPLIDTVAKVNFNEAKLMSMLDGVAESSDSNIDFITGSYDVRRAYSALLSQNKVNADILRLEGGYTALSFNGVPFIADKFLGSGKVYFLNSQDFRLHQLGDWQWIENDKGQILRQKEGFPTHSATLVKYAELVCSKPGGQAKLSVS